MIVRFGPKCPNGFLPVYSVDTMEEAEELLIASCERNVNGEFVARELAFEQSIDNLFAFGDRLARNHATIKERRKELSEGAQDASS